MTIETEVAALTTSTTDLVTAVGLQQIAVAAAVAIFEDTTSRVDALNLVDNTTDADKEVSTAQQTALDAKQPTLDANNIKTVNGVTLLGVGNVVVPRGPTSLNALEYENRATLRAVPASPRLLDDSVVIEGLGLFMWTDNQYEPDDDETCFTDNLGQWLLSVPAYDLLSAMALVEDSYRDDLDEDESTRFAAYFATL